MNEPRAALLALAGAVLFACPVSNPSDAVRRYGGSASRGDLVTFQIDPERSAYVVTNETTGKEETGTYAVADGDLAGVKTVTAGGNTFFAVELDDKVIAANFPVGNDEANISFGVSSALDNTGRESQIAGTYSWIIMSGGSVNGSADIRRWGLLVVDAAGTFKKYDYATAAGNGEVPAMAPQGYSGPFPPTGTADETGTWALASADKVRLEVHVDGVAATLTGFAYAQNDASVFLLDLGPGNGFMLGLKNPTRHLTLAEIAGTYKFVDLWNGQYRGAGRYTLAATADGTYAHQDQNGQLAQGYLDGIAPVPNIPNMFYIQHMEWGTASTDDDNLVELAVVGKVILHFIFDANGGFVSYGAGARLD